MIKVFMWNDKIDIELYNIAKTFLSSIVPNNVFTNIEHKSPSMINQLNNIVFNISTQDDLCAFIDLYRSIIHPIYINIHESDYIYPCYNLAHIGPICYFNVCINMLASCYDVLIHCGNDDNKDNMLCSFIIHNHSPVDVEYASVLQLMNSLNLSPNEANDYLNAMNKIYTSLNIDEHILYNFDKSTDTLDDVISKINPKNIIIDVDIVNTMYNIVSDTFDNNIECLKEYCVQCIICYNNGHYVCWYPYVNRMLNDLYDRCYANTIANQYIGKHCGVLLKRKIVY